MIRPLSSVCVLINYDSFRTSHPRNSQLPCMLGNRSLTILLNTWLAICLSIIPLPTSTSDHYHCFSSYRYPMVIFILLLFSSPVADLVLKDKIFVYDLANQRIGWANYDCKFVILYSIYVIDVS